MRNMTLLYNRLNVPPELAERDSAGLVFIHGAHGHVSTWAWAWGSNVDKLSIIVSARDGCGARSLDQDRAQLGSFCELVNDEGDYLEFRLQRMPTVEEGAILQDVLGRWMSGPEATPWLYRHPQESATPAQRSRSRKARAAANSTEALLSKVVDEKRREDLRRIFAAHDSWNDEGRRIDLDEHAEHIREMEVSNLVDEIIDVFNEKDNFDLEVDVNFFLDERGYVVTEQLADEIVSRAWQKITAKTPTTGET